MTRVGLLVTLIVGGAVLTGLAAGRFGPEVAFLVVGALILGTTVGLVARR